MRFFRSVSLYLIVLVVALGATGAGLYLGGRPVSGDSAIVRVEIPQGASARKIADILDEHGLVRSKQVFLLTCRSTGSADKLKPGVYGLSRSMNATQLVRKLVSGEALASSVTIPEGFTVRQIADTLERDEFVDGNAFTHVAITQGYQFPRYAFIHGHSLEGYLFPDTYLLEKSAEPSTIIDKMLGAFNDKVMGPNRFLIQDVAQKRLGVPRDSLAVAVHKIITLASLVEREARKDEDRPVIAAVLWNRLAAKMKLEVCATVSYRPGESRENKKKVSIADTRVDSPYNCYLHAGLPPGPICSPGTAAIEAVLKPASVNYLYYVARKDGSHIFSRTYKEHLLAKKTAERE